jgi:CNT family concentrative nucleoside transporter
MTARLGSLAGLLGFAALAWALGRGRAGAAWRPVLLGVGLQLLIAAVAVRVDPVRRTLAAANAVVDALYESSRQGTALVFGYLGGAPLPFAETIPGGSFILAFRALPVIMVVGALSALLYHWGLIPLLVRGAATGLRRGFGLSGPAGVATAANVLVGMVEAPMLVRPYLGGLSRPDLFVVMTAGLATVSGNTMVLYAIFLDGVVPDPIGQLLTASVISAPAAVLVARLMLPAQGSETEPPPPAERAYSGSMEALARGTADGLAVMLGVIAALVVFTALVALLNMAIAPATGFTLQALVGFAMRPLAFAMGIPWDQAAEAGRLLGIKTVINEFVASLEFGRSGGAGLDARARVILAYALCGFANPASLGIMLAGMSTLCPERRADFAALGPGAVLSGTLACLMTGAAVGVVLPG